MAGLNPKNKRHLTTEYIWGVSSCRLFCHLSQATRSDGSPLCSVPSAPLHNHTEDQNRLPITQSWMDLSRSACSVLALWGRPPWNSGSPGTLSLHFKISGEENSLSLMQTDHISIHTSLLEIKHERFNDLQEFLPSLETRPLSVFCVADTFWESVHCPHNFFVVAGTKVMCRYHSLSLHISSFIPLKWHFPMEPQSLIAPKKINKNSTMPSPIQSMFKVNQLSFMGWIICPTLHPTSHNLHVEDLIPPGPHNVTVFGDRVFKEVIKLKWSHEGGLLIQNDARGKTMWRYRER